MDYGTAPQRTASDVATNVDGQRRKSAVRGGTVKSYVFAAIVALSSSLSPGPARAQDASAESPTRTEMRTPNSGIQVSARIGVGGGYGDVVKGVAIGDAAKYAVPLTVDVGYRFDSHWYLGLYGQYAYVSPKEYEETCPAGFDCSVSDYRLGLAAQYHILPSGRLDPWVGLGFGYEWLRSSANGSIELPVGPGGALVPGQVDASITDRGFEMGHVEVGADYRFNRSLSVGPALTITYARYNVRSGSNAVTVGGVTQEQSLKVTHANHGLILLALRGTFNVGL
jgi:outer membrane protein W